MNKQKTLDDYLASKWNCPFINDIHSQEPTLIPDFTKVASKERQEIYPGNKSFRQLSGRAEQNMLVSTLRYIGSNYRKDN